MILPVPGDFAVIIQDSEFSVDGKSNIGKKVHVQAWLPAVSLPLKFLELLYGPAVIITALEPIWAVDTHDPDPKRVLGAPGVSLSAPQSFLKRLDPDNSGEELYQAEPTKSERYYEMLEAERKRRTHNQPQEH